LLLALLLVLLALLGGAGGCAAGRASQKPGTGPGLAEPPLPRDSLQGVWYTIVEQDRLPEIAARHGLQLQDLLEINDLASPDPLPTGREIFLPVSPPERRTSQAPLARQDPDPAPPPKAQGRFVWPVQGGRLTSRFGRRWGRQHEGIDLAAPTGTPIHASAAGEVIYSGQARGYGNLVLLKHDAKFVTVYAHCRVNLVQEGERVVQGEPIAEVGSTGHSTGPHLHFEVRDDSKPRNPLSFLEGVPPR
jgi:hypothetical protein